MSRKNREWKKCNRPERCAILIKPLKGGSHQRVAYFFALEFTDSINGINLAKSCSKLKRSK